MEFPSSPERIAVVRRDDDRDSIRNGIGVDGKGEHRPIFEGRYQRRSVGACMFLIQGP